MTQTNRSLVFNLLIFIFFGIFSFESQAQSKSTFAVSLDRVEGVGPFYDATMFIHRSKDFTNFAGIPDGLEVYNCFEISLNQSQRIFDKYKNSEPLDKYEKAYFENGLDTNLLSKEKLKHTVIVFSGIKENKKIIIFDNNHNEDFSDDQMIEFDLDLTKKEEDYWIFFGAPIRLNFERFDPNKGQPIQRDVITKIIPFSEGRDLEFDLLNFEHHVGTINFDKKNYQIAVSTTLPLSDDFSQIEVSTSVAGEKINQAESIKKLKRIGEYIRLGDKDFLIEKITPIGNTIFLKQQPKPVVQSSKINEVIHFEKEDLMGGKINTKNYSDQYLLLNFWGTWCGPCKKKIPFLNELQEIAADKNLTIIGIAKDNDEQKLKEFIETQNIKWKNIFEDKVDYSDKRLTEVYKVTSFPTMFLILPNGGGVMSARTPAEAKELQSFLQNLPVVSESKNLVPNHSFEQVKFINQDFKWRTANGKQFNEMSIGWITPEGSSPDYLDHKTRKKYFFYDYNVKLQNYRAIDGDKHVGISVYGCHRNSGACREYAQIKLNRSLEKGKKYTVEFWVSRIRNGATINNLGAYFSNEPLTEIHVELAGHQPQILKKEAIGEKPFIWEKISGTFIAEDNFKYIAIGNFFPDEKTNTYGHAATGLNIAYFFLDNIIVEAVDETANENPFDKVELGKTYVLKNLHFAFADSVVLEKSHAELNNLLAFLKRNSKTKVEIVGHTDNFGKREFNMELSKKRSKAVRSFLIKRGIISHRIISKGMGDLNPIASNETESGRKLNRRVEIRLIEETISNK